ncbi:MAG: xanthine dehydrogenase family protein molybdopterin-binding subunit [Thiothrix sp.]|nr:MAG: xanthine dehydrogenase family protein molybdopterin-binding subunit [Thiothrix sp.]
METINLSRRHFFKVAAAVAGSLTLGVYWTASHAETAPQKPAGPGEAGSPELKQGLADPQAFIRIDPDSTVHVIVKHMEMGQGSHTGIATLIADEMDADWAQIRAENSPADASRYGNMAFGGMQGTGGSTSMANSYLQMRQAGAAAKFMLVGAAATLWNLPANEITVKAGIVSHPSGKTAKFGELAEAAQKQPVPSIEQLKLKTPEQFIYIGKPALQRVDIMGKVNGTAQFTQDVQLPDMLTAVVAHAPLFGASLASVDDTAAKAIKGVKAVVSLPNAVAVLASDFWSAKQGRDALKITWDESKAYKANSADQLASYQKMAETAGKETTKIGNPAEALASAATLVKANYSFPYLAHAAMEPLNCVVHITDKGCELWYGAQLQTIDQAKVSELLKIEPAQVNIHTLYAGGSFGRRGNPMSDYVLEAVKIAKASNLSVPIKMVWTREDDMRAGHYRPMFFHSLQAGLDKDKQLIAWQQRLVGQSIMAGTPMAMMITDGYDPVSVEGAGEPYAIPNKLVELHTPEDIPVPVQWWRSVGHTHTAYATECFMDEMAKAAGKDPVEFRRGLLKDSPRHLAVLNLAAEKAGWGSELPKGKGRGIAVVESFNSYVAEVAEVTVKEDGSFTVDKVVLAVDCGLAVNPSMVEAQMVGGVGFALSAALGEKITLKNGQVEQSNFHDYTPLRIGQMPVVEVHIVPSQENPSGVGEPGVPPLAPAVANALFAATGKRRYELPLGTKA